MLAEQLKLIMAEEGNSEDFWHAGLPCSVWRSPHSGAWAGYVGVNTTSPLHCESYYRQWLYDGYEQNALNDVEVHGGITFSDYRLNRGDIWWFGFDCAHWGDVVPSIGERFDGMLDPYATYKSKHYAMRETKQLAEQIAEIEAELSE